MIVRQNKKKKGAMYYKVYVFNKNKEKVNKNIRRHFSYSKQSSVHNSQHRKNLVCLLTKDGGEIMK